MGEGVSPKKLPPETVNTYYPVVHWETVKLSAFSQQGAPSREPYFIDIPSCFNSNGVKCGIGIGLNIFPYDKSKAARLWYKNFGMVC